MIDFIIKSAISLTILLGFYHLVLEREKIHKFNRFYLLFAIVISFAIPFLTFEIIKIVPVVQQFETLNTVVTAAAIPESEIQENVEPIEESIDFTPYILWSLYAGISLLLMVRFGKNIWKLTTKSKSNPSVKYKNANLVLVPEKTLPHTFLNSIFINFEDYNNRNIEDELYTHELVHVTQKHTLDILFIEFLKVIFWFNLIFILYKKAIQLNHEFLADEEIVKTYNNVPFYQNLLLQKGSGTQTIYLASNLNYLVTKKRLIMMTKSTSQKIAVLKKIAIVPILAGLIYFFCVEVVAQEKVVGTKTEQKKEQKKPEITDKDRLRDAYYKGVWVKICDNRINTTINKRYEELSLEEKRNYLSWVPDMIIEKEVPAPLFEKMKSENMAVWINGKASSKEEIRKYKRTDFNYYTYSFVHKNARSKRFPQEYQYTLYTKKYFDENLKNSHLHFSNDTLKLAISEPGKEWKKVDNILSPKKGVDTIVSQIKGREGYNIHIKETKNEEITEPKSIQKIDTAEIAKYFKGVRFILKDGDNNCKIIIDKLYEELTKEEKGKFGGHIYLIPKPFKKKSPTQKEMDEFKNSKKYAIWIDGKNVPNEQLNKYKPKDIAHFSGSVVLKNARSKKFPQPFQYWFSTHKDFEESGMGDQVTKYPGDKIVITLVKKLKNKAD